VEAIGRLQIERAGVRLHAAEVRPKEERDPPLLLLHGFPDHWIGWRSLLHAFPSRRVIAPDGRGVNLSDAPGAPSAYALTELTADVLAFADAFGAAQIDLAGHDWGGVTAWAVAQQAPDRIRRLAILNAPHPFVMGQALAQDPEQRQRSAYITALRADQAEARLAAAEFAPLLQAFVGVPLSPEEIAERIAAWSRPGRLRGALNWYRAASFLDDAGESWRPRQALPMPVLLIWGRQDGAFAPSLIEAHHAIAAKLTLKVFAALGHWPHRESPSDIAALLSDWFSIDD
jgi:epoxide hydrolase 4